MIRYERWKVALGVVVFLLLMGIVGRIDRESQQAVADAYSTRFQQARR